MLSVPFWLELNPLKLVRACSYLRFPYLIKAMFPDSALDEKSLLEKVCEDASPFSGMCTRVKAESDYD